MCLVQKSIKKQQKYKIVLHREYIFKYNHGLERQPGHMFYFPTKRNRRGPNEPCKSQSYDNSKKCIYDGRVIAKMSIDPCIVHGSCNNIIFKIISTNYLMMNCRVVERTWRLLAVCVGRVIRIFRVNRTRVGDGPFAKDAAVERWFFEPIGGVHGEHQHYHHQQEYDNGVLEVHIARYDVFLGSDVGGSFD